jgi:hypothetical protein
VSQDKLSTDKKEVQSRDWLITLSSNYYDSIEKVTEKLSARGWNFVGQEEIGKKTGYRHLQIFLQSPKGAIRQSTLKNALPGGHFEKRRGSPAQAVAYVTKEETRASPVFSHGSIDTKEQQGKRSDLQRFHEKKILSGTRVNSLVLTEPKSWLYIRQLRELENIARSEKLNQPRELSVNWLYGSGDRTARFYETFPYQDIYRVANYRNPFDSYNLQDILLLDNFTDSCLEFEFLLNVLMSPYPARLPARFQDKPAAYSQLWVSSESAPDSYFHTVQRFKTEQWRRFLATLDNVVTVDQLHECSPELATGERNEPSKPSQGKAA